jgi:hypothetical protein
MNDDHALAIVRDRLAQARDCLGEIPPTVPASQIMARAGRRRARRRLVSAAAACAAAGLTALGLVLAPGSHAVPAFPSANQARPVHVNLAAWSVDTNSDGTVSFQLRSIAQPARLQQVLADAGVPAMVRWGQICLAQGAHATLPTWGFVRANGLTGPQPGSVFLLMSGGDATGTLDWSWTITPSKIPPGTQFVISALPGNAVPPGDIQAEWEFVLASAPVKCAKSMT